MKIPLGIFARLMLRFEAEQMVKDQVITDLLVANAALRQEITDLVAGDTETAAKVEAAFQKSEATEAKMRAAAAGR